MKNYIKAFKNMFNFKDEATLSEFWSFFVVNMIVSFIVIFTIQKFYPDSFLISVYRTFILFVLFSLGFRRLKNAGLSGWLFLIPFVNIFLASLPEKDKKVETT